MALTNITSKDMYHAFLHGAYEVVSNRQFLNKINVFPIQDGDTGTNLSSLMETIINESTEGETVKQTLESFSDAAIRGARGNSGIIFAQYIYGLSMEVSDNECIDYNQYALASKKAAEYAYDSIDQPVEGTILTVMRDWGEALSKYDGANNNITELLSLAITVLNDAVTKTQYQLKELRKAKVVDAGANGFSFFIHGMLEYFKKGSVIDIESIKKLQRDNIDITVEHDMDSEITYRYCTECLIRGSEIDTKRMKKSLNPLGDSLVVAANKDQVRIHIHSNEPENVFEILRQNGNVEYQKVDDMKKQQDVMLRRKSDIAILTDSIADLPQEFIDSEQIHIINMTILFENTSFIDKLSITPKQLLDYSKDSKDLPTSSQPDEKSIENILLYLSTHYKSLIIMTVSKQLSGTYNTITRVAKRIESDHFKIDTIDTKQNSGAQGLLVAKAADLISQGYHHNEIVDIINNDRANSKILVRVKTLDNMIKSGRLSTTMGKIGKRVGLKPIVTLDKDGNGKLDSVSFTTKDSLNKLVRHVKKIMKSNTIESYNIVHINNLEEAKELKILFTELIGKEPRYIMETSSIVAIGAGSGAVALSYTLKNQKS
ncbi:DAK2 domain-containing protein [Carnobacterium sp.]|uniref:DAK2 domain-containing protein n=1 Tax=Carnobacterium sp. TaxID=48221 RepID=UPI003C76D3E0